MNNNNTDNHTECIHTDCRVPTCANYKARKARHSQSGVLPLQCTVDGCFKCTATRRNVAAALAANMTCPVCGAAMHSPATKKGVTFKKQQAAHNKTQKQRDAEKKKAEAERKAKTPLPAKKAPAKKAPAKKAPANKAPANKGTAKKAPAKKAPAKKAPAKKTTTTNRKKALATTAPTGLQLSLLPLC
jgi:DNA-binding protein HU-beta